MTSFPIAVYFAATALTLVCLLPLLAGGIPRRQPFRPQRARHRLHKPSRVVRRAPVLAAAVAFALYLTVITVQIGATP